MTVRRKDKDKTIYDRKGGIVVRRAKEKKSAAERYDDDLRKAAKKLDSLG